MVAPGVPKRKAEPEALHPVVRWLRTAGIVAELFGLGGLLLGGWFWPGVALIYAGFLLLAVDVWLEPGLRHSPRWRIAILAVLMLFTVGFSWAMVFVEAPLELTAFVTDAEYRTGTSIAGIPWKPQFTELQVWISNTSSRNYEDLNLLIRPIFPIAAIAQLTNVPNVSFEDNHGLSLRLSDINVGTMKATAIPLVLLATDAGYRMRCPHLAARTEIKVVMALADIKWNPSPPQPQRPVEEGVRAKDFVLRLKTDDFSTYWLGHANGDVYAPRPTSSDWVKIEGRYTAAERTRSVSQKVSVGGSLRIRRP